MRPHSGKCTVGPGSVASPTKHSPGQHGLSEHPVPSQMASETCLAEWPQRLVCTAARAPAGSSGTPGGSSQPRGLEPLRGQGPRALPSRGRSLSPEGTEYTPPRGTHPPGTRTRTTPGTAPTRPTTRTPYLVSGTVHTLTEQVELSAGYRR